MSQGENLGSVGEARVPRRLVVLGVLGSCAAAAMAMPPQECRTDAKELSDPFGPTPGQVARLRDERLARPDRVRPRPLLP